MNKIRQDYGEKSGLDSSITDKNKYQLYLDRFVEIALGQIKWNNLPKEVDERYLELKLLTNGSALFFKDDIFGYAGIGTTAYGKWNIYGIPEERTAYGANGAQFTRTSKDSVIVWNKLTHGSDWNLLTDYAKKLALLDSIIMINANAQKTPILVKCTEKQRLTLLNLYRKYEGNEPFIFADDGLDVTGFETLGTGAPLVIDKLYELKTNIWNEALTYLGVLNLQETSGERVTTDAVSKLLSGTMASRETRLKAREIACKEINEMFGLNLSVEFVDSNMTEEKKEKEEKEENVSRETNEGGDIHG